MSYTVPSGTGLGEVLGIQHDHASGIQTRQNPDGTWELIGWPAGLGAAPSQANVTAWATAQAAAKPDRVADAEFQNAKLLRAFAQALKIQFPALNLSQLASDTKAAFRNL